MIEQTILPTIVCQEDIDNEVVTITSSLGKSFRDFVSAQNYYNLEFFRNEPYEYQVALAKGLHEHFEEQGSNPYWVKLMSNAPQASI